jgi:hypothetical protein
MASIASATQKLRCLALAALLLLAPLPVLAAGFKLERRDAYVGQTYDELRAALESSGWEAEALHSIYPDYPEIHCALSGACVGYWKKAGKEIYIEIDSASAPFRVRAIQTDVEYQKEMRDNGLR